MPQIVKWLTQAVQSIVDPDKDQRVQALAAYLQNALHTQGRAFNLAAVLQSKEYSASDLELATDRVLRVALERGWSDGELTTREQEMAVWIAKSLQIPTERARSIYVQFAVDRFGAVLARAMEDGVLSESEEEELRRIAATIGQNLPQVARTFFRAEGEGFLRAIFLACVSDGEISQAEWDHLLAITAKLGIDKTEMLLAIQPQARQFVEHILADAKSDNYLSNSEEATLRWLLHNLGLPANFRRYVDAEVTHLRKLRDIADGRLPSIHPPAGVQTRSGEIVHLHIPAAWRHVRMLKSGPTVDEHSGTLTLTDNRFVFSSVTKSHSTSYRKVISFRGGPGGIEVQVENKPATAYFFSGNSPIPFAIFQAALAMANQKLLEKSGRPSRHIPRDVRQRVWQRYGGRCAECEADDYLEFDHIVPVAKGGSNSDLNVQLLCRRCNLKKSDAI